MKKEEWLTCMFALSFILFASLSLAQFAYAQPGPVVSTSPSAENTSAPEAFKTGNQSSEASPSPEQSLTRNRDLVELAEQTQHRSDALLSYVSWVSSGWLAVVTLIFIALAFFGWQEIGLLRAAEQTAKQAAAQATLESAAAKESNAAASKAASDASAASVTAKNAEEVASAAGKTVTDIGDKVKRSLVALPHTHAQLPFLRLGVVGEAPKLPSPVELARFEEADILAVLADQTGSASPEDLAELFARVGYYWRRIRNQPRAMARFQRAIELNPKLLPAHRGLCGAIYNAAVQQGIRPPVKNEMLAEAERVCQVALKEFGEDAGLYFDLGWIHDERGDYPKAVEEYKNAEKLDPKCEQPQIRYNLSCTYSKLGKMEEAFNAIKPVIGVEDNWKDAEIDNELANLRNDPKWGGALKQLIDE